MYLKMLLRIVAVHAVNVKQITACWFTVEEGCDTNFTQEPFQLEQLLMSIQLDGQSKVGEFLHTLHVHKNDW
jgi:hypothetical protein